MYRKVYKSFDEFSHTEHIHVTSIQMNKQNIVSPQNSPSCTRPSLLLTEPAFLSLTATLLQESNFLESPSLFSAHLGQYYKVGKKVIVKGEMQKGNHLIPNISQIKTINIL